MKIIRRFADTGSTSTALGDLGGIVERTKSMTDLDAIEYIEELKGFNSNGEMITPNNKNLGYDTFYQCAFDHAIRALKEHFLFDS